MILMIDNYDSFTYNLVHYLEMLDASVQVVRNDALSLDDIRGLKPEMIVISPGPCTPEEAGISLEVVTALQGQIPLLGVCLGHQVIAQALGARVVRAKQPVHGKLSPIRHNGQGAFHGLANPLQVTRYHSLIIERETLPAHFEITAETYDGEIMGIRHKRYPLEGVQFHPEAVLTEGGMEVLQNFLITARRFREEQHAC